MQSAARAARARPAGLSTATTVGYDIQSNAGVAERTMDPTGREDAGDLEVMRESSEQASRLLKALSNQDRLMILCILADGEKCVSELEDILGIRQPTLSQQLARLRADDLVSTRRDGKVVHYSLASNEAGRVIDLLFDLYCAPALAARAGATAAA